ncbi:hypothetical protein SAMN05660485_02915 [Blastococcus fimeti]|nr:hypothetical protein SAMN05660485_02915 [Blastococcus fimeti]
MGHGMHRTLRVVVLLLVALLCSAAGCFRSAPSGGAGLIDDLGRAASQADELAELGVVVGDDVAVPATRTRLGGLLDDVPDDPSAELAAAAQRARQAQAALDAAEDALAQAELAARELADSGDAAATAAVEEITGPPLERVRLRDQLAARGKEIVHEIACETAWDELKPAEQEQIDSALQEGSVLLTYVNSLQANTESAVDDAVYRDIAAHWGERVAGLVDWFQYGKGILEKATDLVGDDLDEPIVGLDVTMSRAWLYWARLCLAPPR